jgi:hypothetical protein
MNRILKVLIRQQEIQIYFHGLFPRKVAYMNHDGYKFVTPRCNGCHSASMRFVHSSPPSTRILRKQLHGFLWHLIAEYDTNITSRTKLRGYQSASDIYTDRASADGRRILVPTSAYSGVLRGQSGGSALSLILVF